MKPSKFVTAIGAKKRRSFSIKSLPTLALLCAAVFIGSTFIVTDYKERFSPQGVLNIFLRTQSMKCQGRCKPIGTEALPKGIISSTSDLEMRPLWGTPVKKKSDKNLLAMAVGLKHEERVDKIVRKFTGYNFAVILFHYDGNVDDWSDFKWSTRVLHVVAAHQTKWWFAKRFLHPDIVSQYSYIFLWDGDLGVENFNVQRYLSVIKKEGLQISQPALDQEKSEGHRAVVHRRIDKVLPGGRKCNENSTEPPCTGWVEMMAPVFSRAAWRCAWYMIQNDLVHEWGAEFQLGYCAQGDRTKYIGIVDSDYVVHYGLPTVEGTAQNETDAKASRQGAKIAASLDSPVLIAN
ncbi:unnamed protein product [Amaranthus hypochondriacus]